MKPLAFFLPLCLLLGSALARGEEKKAPDPDEQLLRQAGIATDEAGLRKYLRECADFDAKVRRIPALIRQLGAKGFLDREKASAALIAVGQAALPALQLAAKDRDVEIARRAKKCIETLNPRLSKAEIMRRIAEEQERALAKERKLPPPPRKVKIPESPPDPGETFGWRHRQLALRLSLRRGAVDPASEGFVAALQSPDPDVHRLAESALSAIVHGYGSSYPFNQAELQTLRPKVASIMAHVIGGLESQDTGIQVGAKEALTRMGWFELLRRAETLKNATSPKERIQIMQDLWSVRCYRLLVKGIVPALLPLLKDPSAEVRQIAAEKLGEGMVLEAPRVILALIAALAEPNTVAHTRFANSMRQQVAYSLGAFGSQADPAIPALLTCTKDKKGGVRGAALVALARIAPCNPKVVRAVQEALYDKDADARQGAISAVHVVKLPPDILVPRLMEIFKNPGGPYERIKGGLETEDDRVESVRNRVLEALGHIGPAARAAIPFLIEVIERNPGHRWYALIALRGIGPIAAKDALHAVLRVLRDDRREECQLGAILALGNFGPAAKPAVRQLMAVVMDPRHKRRREGAEALVQIEPATGRMMLQILDREQDAKKDEPKNKEEP